MIILELIKIIDPLLSNFKNPILTKKALLEHVLDNQFRTESEIGELALSRGYMFTLSNFNNTLRYLEDCGHIVCKSSFRTRFGIYENLYKLR